MAFVTASGMETGPIGQGTWYMGEDPGLNREEEASLRAGIDAGMNLIDTAEMYGEGLAEELVGRAIRGYDRDKLYLVSKVYPHNAGRGHIFRACRNSMERMGVDYLDLYLLHWRGRVPLAETVECMEELKRRGWIRDWGVSNLDTDDMMELLDVPGGDGCLTDQVLYHLGSRGIEYDLLPLLRRQGIQTMAYCPLAKGGGLRRGIMEHPAVTGAAEAHDATSAQILLAFLLAQEGVIPIPKASHAARTMENAEAAKIQLTAEELNQLNHAFPAPRRKVMLDIL